MFTLTKATKDKLKEWGGWLATASAGAAAIAAITWPPGAIPLLGGALLGSVVYAWGSLAREDISTPHHLAVRDATPEDVTYLHSRITAYAASIVPIAERMKISDKNPACFRVIEDIRDGGAWRRTVGTLATYPLDEASAARIRAGEMTGADITAEIVLESFSDAAAIYVSFAEGPHDGARVRLMAELLRLVSRVKRRPLLVAGIPTTAEALKIMAKRGFKGLKSEALVLDEICIIDVPQDGPEATRPGKPGTSAASAPA